MTHNSLLIHNFYILMDQICWAGATFGRIIKSDITDGLTEDRRINLGWAQHSTTSRRASMAFLAGIKKLNFSLPSQQLEIPHV